MQDWRVALRTLLASSDPKPLALVGIGNPVKRDDSVGLYIAERLRREVGPRPSPRVRIHRPVVNPEVVISRIDPRSTILLIFDAVEASAPAGSVILSNLYDTRYGFFVTHNIPLRLHPDLLANGKNVFVLGVQPQDLGIGEGLSVIVRSSADEVVSFMRKEIGGVLDAAV